MQLSESQPLLSTSMDVVIDVNPGDTNSDKQSVGMSNGHMVEELNQQVRILQQHITGGNALDFTCRGGNPTLLPFAATTVALSVLALVVVNVYSTVFTDDDDTSTFKVAGNSVFGVLTALGIVCFGCSILKGRRLRRNVDTRNEKILAEKQKVQTLSKKLNLLSPSSLADAPVLVESLKVARSISVFSEKWVPLWPEDFPPYQCSNLEGKIINSLSYRQLYQMYLHLGDTNKRNQIFAMVDNAKKEMIETLCHLPATAGSNYIIYFIQRNEKDVFSNAPELFKDFIATLPAEIRDQPDVKRAIKQRYYKFTQEKISNMVICADLFGAVSDTERDQLAVLKNLGEDIRLPLKEDWFKRLSDVLNEEMTSENIKGIASALVNRVISLALQKKDWKQAAGLFRYVKNSLILKSYLEFFDYEVTEKEVCPQHANLAITFNLKGFRTRIEKALIEKMNRERTPLEILRKYRDIPEFYEFLQKNSEKYISKWNFKEFWRFVEEENAGILRKVCLQYAAYHEEKVWELWKPQKFPEAIAERWLGTGKE